MSSQGSLFKSMLHGSGLYSIALIGQRLVGLALMPILTRSLTKADYGAADLLEQASVVLGVLLGVNFSAAVGYFYFNTDSEEARRKVVGTTVIGAAAIGACAAVICWPFASPLSHLIFRNGAEAGYLRLVFISLMPSFLFEALLTWLRVKDRPDLYVRASLLRVGTTATGVVILVGLLKMHVWGMLYTALAALIITDLAVGTYCIYSVKPTFDGALFLRMLKFAAPVGMSFLAMFIINVGDRFILTHYRSLDDVGVYALGYKVGMLMSVLYASFHIYWSAQAFQIMQRADADEVFPRIFSYVMAALSFFALALIVCTPPALRILAAKSFRGAGMIVPLIVLAYYVRAIGDFLRCLFVVGGKPGYDAACNWVGAFACLIGYFTLIPRFGMWGAAYATLAAFLVICTISVVWTRRFRRYRVEAGRLGKIAGAAAGAAAPFYLAGASSLPAQIGVAVLSLSIFPFLLWLLRFPTEEEMTAGRAAFQWLARRLREGAPGKAPERVDTRQSAS